MSQALWPTTALRKLPTAVAIGCTPGKLVPSPQPTIPSAVSTLTKSQGAYPRTPVSKCGSTLTIFRESASALRCNPNREGVLPTLDRSPPVIPTESCPRKSRRERAGVSPKLSMDTPPLNIILIVVVEAQWNRATKQPSTARQEPHRE